MLELAEFRKDLDELACTWPASMQERPIVHLIAKYLRRRGHKFGLEVNHCDLVVDSTRIEFKFNFNRCEEKLDEELRSIAMISNS